MRSRDQLAARFEGLVERYGDRLLAYLLRRVPAEDAADVAADTLMTAWRRVRVMPDDDEQAFWWLLSIGRRSAANHRRGIVRRTALGDRLRALPTSAIAPALDDTGLLIRQLLDRLSDDDQELIRLVYWDDLPLRAAATVLGIGESAARKRLQRARDTLRVALDGTPDEEMSRVPIRR
ncbi:RNA polymerase sigma factor [Aeromicrobium duanguangcaii]|uniref:Sigma-70 family RNA polymerase sigma factor n=1 Tax=Aeromicrobium duanguangcaii TaxID=2968086 RepID=A0ABY5KHT8_9ACTN|nr:sigma-70 family RNA polymerase sigma factor [Aeromicrobium duanguangcaii]MCD9153025.1 sigma-70 family RNA polymerase sigma factor [Aeromicrobium duanguangcaii]MCL3836979.1 sigma-70 family RNA polymerase sigma factor [Aeromicrobium duanguangcaii]UUI69869.1 sigma-70 family RNA polymerase sigma factor [Aeromicrobium duanguangcaii]